ncbi:hypothetical protein WJX77_000614 [Trebouxia sp. C0004]
MSFKRRSSPRSATTRGLHLSNPHYKLPHSYFIPSAVVMLCLVTIPAQIPTTYPGCQKAEPGFCLPVKAETPRSSNQEDAAY